MLSNLEFENMLENVIFITVISNYLLVVMRLIGNFTL